MENKKSIKSNGQKAIVDIKKYIISENMQQGDKLPNEFKLAEICGVSRGTIREAIRYLVSEGFLEVIHGSGTYVKNLNPIKYNDDPMGFKDGNNMLLKAIEFFEVRLIVEPESAAKAAENATEEECNELIDIYNEFKKCVESGESYLELDIKFHKQIAKCTHNSVMGNLIDIICNGIPVFIKVTENKYAKDTITFHYRICNAIVNGDPIEARCSMIEHLNINRRGILEKLNLYKEFK